MIPMSKYKNHMRVDQACSRERNDIHSSGRTIQQIIFKQYVKN